MSRLCRSLTLLFALVAVLAANAVSAQPRILVEGDHFTVNGVPRFLIFVSYFDAMRAARGGPCPADFSQPTLQCDLKYIKEVLRFDGVRIFVNWLKWADLSDPTNPQDNWFGADTLLTFDGGYRPDVLAQLLEVLDAAGAAGLIVDLTFTRDTVCGVAPVSGSGCPDQYRMSIDAYRSAVRDVVSVLANQSARFPHVVVDLQNERNLDRTFQNLPDVRVLELATAIRAVGGPISRKLGASIATPSTEEVAASVSAGGLDIADWHEPRDANWFAVTESRVHDLRARLAAAGVVRPINMQEPQRWQDDRNPANHNTAVQGAKRAGAAAWTFHTRTSFSLENTSFSARLNLDGAQRAALAQLKTAADQVPWGATLPPPELRIVTMDAPVANSSPAQPFVLGGWAIDSRGAGTGVDTVHVWAFPANGGNPIFCGAAYNGPRPDVGAVYGARFTNSGYTLIIRDLPTGVYTFVAYAHSTFSGAFDNWIVRSNIAVRSDPRLTIDTPAANQVVPHAFFVGGWALDLGSGTTTGVSTVHVWAYPAAGGPAVFAGVATYGVYRPDVGAALGSQFTNSGFHLVISTLPAGTWDLALFPYSTLMNAFAPAVVRRVTVSP